MSTRAAADAPVVLFVFNRPDTTARVIEAVSRTKPSRLFVVADGPREHVSNDRRFCAEVRNIIQTGVDWPCELLTNYSEINLGCRRRIVTGMEWVFSLADEAIVLEDDCVAHPDFFLFARQMLEKYRDSTHVLHINGTNVQGRTEEVRASHFFSAYSLPWGWATWKRAWAHYNVDMTSFAPFVERGGIAAKFKHSRQRKFFLNRYLGHCDPSTPSWDWQWIFTTLALNAYAVTPDSNLISNVGDGDDALHGPNHPYCRMPTFDWKAVSPSTPAGIDNDYDRYVFECYFDGGSVHGWRGMLNAIYDALSDLRIKFAVRSRMRQLLSGIAGACGLKPS